MNNYDKVAIKYLGSNEVLKIDQIELETIGTEHYEEDEQEEYEIIPIKNCYDLKKAYHLAENEGWKIVYTGFNEIHLTKKGITK